MRLRASWMTATVVSCQGPLRWRVPRLTSPLSSVPSSALTRSRCASMPPFKAVQFTANVCLLHDRPVYAFRMAEVRQQSTSAQSAVESVASRPRRGTSSALLKRSAEPGGVDPTGKALERHHSEYAIGPSFPGRFMHDWPVNSSRRKAHFISLSKQIILMPGLADKILLSRSAELGRQTRRETAASCHARASVLWKLQSPNFGNG